MDKKKKAPAKAVAEKPKKVKAEKVATEEVKQKKVKSEKPPREKHKFTYRDIFIVIGIVLTLAIAAVNGYYLANASVSCGQRYTYDTPELKAAAEADGVDISMSQSPMYARTLYMFGLVLASILIIGLFSIHKSVMNFLIYALATPAFMVGTYFLFINGKVDMSTYFGLFHNYFRFFTLFALCGGVFFSIFSLMCHILVYRGYVKLDKMPDWDDLALPVPLELPVSEEVAA